MVYMTVGACIIVHIVQTEKVEWFPNAYYRIPEVDGPVASRIVVPPPPSANGYDEYEFYRPKQNQYHQSSPFQPIPHPASIFPVNDDSDIRLGKQQEKAIYYRRNVDLFICLAAALILINFIQFITDVCLFRSTLQDEDGNADPGDEVVEMKKQELQFQCSENGKTDEIEEEEKDEDENTAVDPDSAKCEIEEFVNDLEEAKEIEGDNFEEDDCTPGTNEDGKSKDEPKDEIEESPEPANEEISENLGEDVTEDGENQENPDDLESDKQHLEEDETNVEEEPEAQEDNAEQQEDGNENAEQVMDNTGDENGETENVAEENATTPDEQDEQEPEKVDDETQERVQNEDMESPETDSPVESGENDQERNEEVEAGENGDEVNETSTPQKKRKKSKRKRKAKPTS